MDIINSPSVGLIYDFISEKEVNETNGAEFEMNKFLLAWYFIVNIITLVIETVVYSGISSKMYASLKGDKNIYNTGFYLSMLVLCSIMIKLGWTCKNILYSNVIPKLYRFLNEILFKKIIDRYKVEYQELKIGEILMNLEQLPYILQTFVTNLLDKYMPLCFTLLITIITLMISEPLIGTTVLIGSVVTFISGYFLINEGAKGGKKYYKKYMEINNYIQDTLSNLFEIYTTNMDSVEKNEYSKIEKDFENTYTDNLLFNMVTSVVIRIISVIVFAFALWILFSKYKDGTVKSEKLIFIMIILGFYSKASAGIADGVLGIMAMYGFVMVSDDFVNKLNITNNDEDSKYSSKTPLNGNIELKNISFKYPGQELATQIEKFSNNESSDSKTMSESDFMDEIEEQNSYSEYILKDVNLTIPTNSTIAIYGKTGSGKTTILKLLLGFYKISKGNIFVDNKNINDLKLNYLRSSISVVNQQVKLFDKTVITNILYGNKRYGYNKQDVIKLMNRLGVESVFSKMKQGLETMAGVNGMNLSGGQKQIVLIMRALLKPSHILVLDEPTSALDVDTKKLILNMIKRLNNKTVIIVTHDPEVAKYSDKTYLLKDSHLVSVNESN
jgi:ABC-type multidrug transport system fused ATPase/permease subunit